MGRHEAWERSLDAATTIRELRERYEAIRAAEVAEWLGKLPEADREPLERMSRSLVARLLHTPMTRIRRPRAEAGDPAQFLAAARELFALDEGQSDREPEDDRDSGNDRDSGSGSAPRSGSAHPAERPRPERQPMTSRAAPSPILRIATRASRLARWQADHVAGRLAALHPQLAIEIVPVTTRGDEVRDRALQDIGGRGLFTKEIEQVLLEGGADLAVHSLKDLETELPSGLAILAVPERADPRDVWVSRARRTLADTPAGTRVGTSSIRRRAQLLASRPDLEVVDLRGNVPTRIAKLERGEDGLEAMVLARAGLLRLGLDELATEVLAPAVCLPAVGQGALAIEGRAENAWIQDLVAPLEHLATRIAVRAERAFLHRLRRRMPGAGRCARPGPRGNPGDRRHRLCARRFGHRARAGLRSRGRSRSRRRGAGPGPHESRRRADSCGHRGRRAPRAARGILAADSYPPRRAESPHPRACYD